ncbi:MAG: Asp23/Gls24 family envelope stress response protein [Lachnospiraceae bacterium]|nr:Asp23/Gls24 family envelope stress response protein [Lachnospiraceae bacterium]MDD3797215.1 Asp23/Gls24 family envelope stress response protein [Lachnospiraceae bacterium]
MANEGTHTSTIETEGSYGEVRIADEVVAIIAGLAASEVKGVSSMAGNVTRDLIEKLGVKSLSKGIRIQVEDGEVKVAMNINMSYGYNVPDTCAEIQDKVKTAIETMTGLEVSEVNIKIANVVMDNAR